MFNIIETPGKWLDFQFQVYLYLSLYKVNTMFKPSIYLAKLWICEVHSIKSTIRTVSI